MLIGTMGGTMGGIKARTMALMLFASACTLDSKSTGEDAGPESSSGSDEGSNSMSNSGGSMSATGSTVSATSNGETTDGLVCPDYVSTPDIGPVVEISVRSESTVPVFLASSGCFATPQLDIIGPGEVVVDHRLSECADRCDDILSGEENSCLVGCPDCGTVSGERLDPGSQETARWLGRTNSVVDLVPSCLGIDDEACPATCKLSDQAPAGTYELSLTVYRSCTGECECDGGAVPTCGLYTQIALSDPEVYTVTIDYPAQTTAEIVITD